MYRWVFANLPSLFRTRNILSTCPIATDRSPSEYLAPREYNWTKTHTQYSRWSKCLSASYKSQMKMPCIYCYVIPIKKNPTTQALTFLPSLCVTGQTCCMQKAQTFLKFAYIRVLQDKTGLPKSSKYMPEKSPRLRMSIHAFSLDDFEVLRKCPVFVRPKYKSKNALTDM